VIGLFWRINLAQNGRHDLRLCPRLATAAQDETGQVRQLKAAGCEKVFGEKITSTTADRPQLQS
jgi:hypothetical protein